MVDGGRQSIDRMTSATDYHPLSTNDYPTIRNHAMAVHTMTRVHFLPFLLLSLFFVACSGSRSGGAGSGMVHHVVMCWLKEPGNAEAREQLIRASHALESVPGVVRVHAGTALPSDRPVVDDSFDVGIVIVLKDTAALPDYLEHPTHRDLVGSVLQPFTQRVLIYDIVE